MRVRTIAALVLSAALVLGAACADSAAESPGSAPQSQGGSPLGIDSALALFRAGLEPIAELSNAAPSIDSAVVRFARMVERRDTAAMRAMVMNRREYGYLYYPTSPYTRPPTIQEPGLNWFLHLQNSEKGATRLLDRFGGRPLTISRHECKGPPRSEGDNRLWDDCVQRIVQGRDTVVLRLFGGIYERGGRFKIFSYSNDL
jgi:hypothetical protein